MAPTVTRVTALYATSAKASRRIAQNRSDWYQPAITIDTGSTQNQAANLETPIRAASSSPNSHKDSAEAERDARAKHQDEQKKTGSLPVVPGQHEGRFVLPGGGRRQQVLYRQVGGEQSECRWRVEIRDDRAEAERDELGERVATAEGKRMAGEAGVPRGRLATADPSAWPSPVRSRHCRGAHGNGNSFLRRRIEISVHGQTQHLGGDPFGDRAATVSHREVAIGGLAMQGPGVVHRGRNAAGGELLSERVSIRATNRVLRPGGRGAFAQAWRRNHTAQQGIVARRSAAPGLDLVGKDFELGEKDRRLNRIETSIHPDPHIVVFVLALSMHAQGADDRGQFRIIGKDGSAVAVAAKRLGREEAGGGQFGERADLSAAPVRAEALRCVGDQPEPVRFCDFLDCVVVGGLAEQVDGDDADRSKTGAPSGVDARFERRWIKIEGVSVNVDEHRHRP